MTTLDELRPLPKNSWHPSIRGIHEQLVVIPNLHATLANHPQLMVAWMKFRNHMVHEATVPRRDLEVVILRTAHQANSQYEWFHHSQIALECGLSNDQIDQIRQDIGAGDWNKKDALLLRAADECSSQNQILAETRDGLLRYYSAQQLLDLMFTIGMYTTLAIMLKTLEVPLDDVSSGFAVERVTNK